MGEAAVLNPGLSGAGTVEFLLDENNFLSSK
jgi:hypothetical protein